MIEDSEVRIQEWRQGRSESMPTQTEPEQTYRGVELRHLLCGSEEVDRE